MLCSYGCGNEGINTLKNGKVCCSNSSNKCPAIRKKNSEKTKVTNKFTINASKIRDNCKWCNKESSLPSIRKHEKLCYLNPENIKICPVCKNQIKDYKHTKTCSPKCSRQYFSEKYKEFGRKNKNLTYRTICFDSHDKQCIVCGEKNIIDVHHFDGNHENKNPSNLIPLCPTHHRYLGSKFEHEIIEKVLEYRNSFLNKCLD